MRVFSIFHHGTDGQQGKQDREVIFGQRLSNKLWVREIGKLTERGHQTALIGTDYRSLQAPLAAAMFVR